MTDSARERIDWERVHDGLARSRRGLEDVAEPPADESRRILARRAAALAEPLVEAAAVTDTLELLVFSCGEATCAVETAHAVEVIAHPQPTPVPCTPPAVFGVLNHRGAMLPLVDVGRLLDEPEPRAGDVPFVVAVQAGEDRLGIRADAVVGIVRVPEREVLSPRRSGARRDSVVRGVTASMVAVLDLEALAADPRVHVDERVE